MSAVGCYMGLYCRCIRAVQLRHYCCCRHAVPHLCAWSLPPLCAGVPPPDQCLIFANKVLQQGHQLRDYGLQENSTLSMHGRLPGGMLGGLGGQPDFSAAFGGGASLLQPPVLDDAAEQQQWLHDLRQCPGAEQQWRAVHQMCLSNHVVRSCSALKALLQAGLPAAASCCWLRG